MFSLSLSRFGYASRHSISYNPRSKPGLVTLWCSYNGSTPGVGADPIKNGDDLLLELFAEQSLFKTAFGINGFVSFSIGSDADVFSILVAILMIKSGKNYSFKNFAGREITFTRSKAGDNNQEVVLVHVCHKTDVGIITLREMNEFEDHTRNILIEAGYSKQKINEKTQLLLSQAVLQSKENSTSESHP